MKVRYKILLAISVVLIIITQSFSFFIKRYITQHSIELVGSKIEFDGLQFNPVKCAFTISDAKLFEPNNTLVFANIAHLYIDLSPWKLRNNEYSISEILLDGLVLNITQEDAHFNFESLFKPLRQDKDTLDSEPIRYSVYNIKVLNSQINFHDKNTDKHISFNNLKLQLPELAWDNAQSKVGLDLDLGEKGKMYIDAQIDEAKDIYTLHCRVEQFDLQSIKEYVAELIDIEDLRGNLAFDYTLVGSLSNIDDIKISGKTKINDLVIFDQNNEELATVKMVDADLFYYKPTRSAFYFRTIKLTEPKTALYFDEESNNWSRFLSSKQKGDSGEDSKLSYVIRLGIIENGSLALSNTRVTPELNTRIDVINGSITNIGNQEEVMRAKYSGNIEQGGTVKGTANFSFMYPEKWAVKAEFKDLPIVNYSQYSEYYLARPMLNGFLSYNFSISVDNNKVINNNTFKISNAVFGDKTDNSTAYKVPVRTAFKILKDKNNVVQFDIPIKGDTSDPDFKLTEEIKVAIKDYLTKTGKATVKRVGKSISDLGRKSEIVTLNYGEIKVPFKQEVILSKMADAVKNGDTQKLMFYQLTDTEKEKEYLALKEVKMLYLKSKQRSSANNEKVLKMKLKFLSDNKPALIKYINEHTTLASTATINKKCVSIVGHDRMDELVQELMDARNAQLSKHLKNRLKLSASNFEIKMGDLSTANQLASPQFKIVEIRGGSKVGVEFGDDF